MDLLNVALEEGIAPAIILGIYLIINKVIDSKKQEKTEKFHKDLMENLLTVNNFVYTIINNYINKNYERCELTVVHNTEVSAFHIIEFVVDTIFNNNIEQNRKSISDNIKTIVNREYNRINSALSLYEINNVKLSTFMESEWVEELENSISDCIFNKTADKSEKINRGVQKINLKFQQISSHISNSFKNMR